MNSINIYPQLRFSEFNDSWTKKTTKEIAPLQRGFDLPISELTAGEYPVVFSNGALKTHNKYMAKAPGVVTGRSGTIGKVTYVEMNFWPHNTALWVTDYCGNDPKYIYYFYYQFKLERLGTGSGVPTLNRNDVHSVIKYIPSLPEQHKIAAFLSAVDKKIQILQKKKELLEQYKKGLMQKIFSREIRFKDDNGQDYPEWEEKMLNYYLSESKTRNYDNRFSKQDVLSVSGDYGIVNQIEFQGRSFAGALVDNYHVVEPGDVVYTKSPLKANPYGIIKSNKGEAGIVSTLYAVYKPKEFLNSNFIDYYFQLDDNLNRYLRPLVHKGAKNDMKINNNRVLIDPVLFPSLPEQERIVQFIELIDEKLRFLSSKLNLLTRFKKGLLQQMFV